MDLYKVSLYLLEEQDIKKPFVLVNGVANLARTKLAGQVVESVVVDTPEIIMQLQLLKLFLVDMHKQLLLLLMEKSLAL